MTAEELDSILLTKRICRVGDFSHVTKRIQFKCTTCGHMWCTTSFKIIKAHTGCPSCAGNTKSTTSEFIAKAVLLHGDTYDYSEVQYTSAKTKVSIACKQHGLFLQTPNSHLNGGGCPTCARNVLNTNGAFDVKLEMAERGVKRIGEYVNAHTPIEVVCVVCNHTWFAKPTKLIGANATGCPKCRTSKGMFGTFVERNGVRFRSRLESECYDMIATYCRERGYTFEHQKKYTQSSTNHSCDFYISELQLWIEVSNIKTPEYVSRIQQKVKWVHELRETFVLAQTTHDLRKVLYGKAN